MGKLFCHGEMLLNEVSFKNDEKFQTFCDKTDSTGFLWFGGDFKLKILSEIYEPSLLSLTKPELSIDQ